MAEAQGQERLVIGLDLSLTSTGIARSDGSTIVLDTPASKFRGMERISAILFGVYHAMFAYDSPSTSRRSVDIAVIEGYSYGSRGSALFEMGELGGVIKRYLWDHLISYIIVPPSTLKHFATGNGQASKADMVSSAQEEGIYDGENHNAADAAWLRAFGLYYLDAAPVVSRTLYRDHDVARVRKIMDGWYEVRR